MIKLINLIKLYGKFRAVDNLNLEIKSGEFFGFIGPNGAGKTTTIKMMVGLLPPSEGTVIIEDFDITKDSTKAKAITGYIPDRPFLYEKLTAREMLNFFGDIYGLTDSKVRKRVDELLDFFEIKDWADELIEGYSLGMKQKLTIATALLIKPKVLVVDEPMVGLDPKTARRVKETFKAMCHTGATIFMSTHILEIAEELCTRVGIINNGKLIAEGNLEELRRMAGMGDSKLENVFLKLTH